MIRQARNRLRSWMFIYAGLVAAIALSGNPADTVSGAAELMPSTAIDTSLPLLRQDI